MDSSVTLDPRHETDKVEQHDVEAVNRRDRQQPLYAARKKIHPKRASGTFRNFKWLVMAVTLGIYYLTPWLRGDRGEFAPDQAVLIDLLNRRFYFFFIEIWPQEFFYVAGMLVMAGIGLFLVTSTVGRAWCGYTCPQTVWVDLFLVVERFVEGERNRRIKLDKEPMSVGKATKRTVKHAIWLLIAVATGGAWIFYFADAPSLFVDVVTGEAPTVAYGTIAVLTFTTYTLGGLMREQVCTYMCPWPRVQGAMLDEHSLTVTYNDWRGENRSLHRKKALAAGESVGDCVDCKACVAVCPQGIDIRDGQQLECITCALCIDACDSVMQKLGLEKGLISYATLNDYNQNMTRAMNDEHVIEPRRVRDETGSMLPGFIATRWNHLIRVRTIIYFVAWTLIGIAMLSVLATRDRLELNVLHDRNPVFVTLSDGSIRNGFEVKILNMMPEPRRIQLRVEGLHNARLTLPGANDVVHPFIMFDAPPDRLLSQKVFVTVPQELLHELPASGPKQFRFTIQDVAGSERADYDAKFESGRN